MIIKRKVNNSKGFIEYEKKPRKVIFDRKIVSIWEGEKIDKAKEIAKEQTLSGNRVVSLNEILRKSLDMYIIEYEKSSKR